jgi:hypothetical protein
MDLRNGKTDLSVIWIWPRVISTHHINICCVLYSAMIVDSDNDDLDSGNPNYQFNTPDGLCLATSAKPGKSGQSWQSCTEVHRATEVTEGCLALQLCTVSHKICPALCRSVIVCQSLYRMAWNGNMFFCFLVHHYIAIVVSYTARRG